MTTEELDKDRRTRAKAALEAYHATGSINKAAIALNKARSTVGVDLKYAEQFWPGCTGPNQKLTELVDTVGQKLKAEMPIFTPKDVPAVHTDDGLEEFERPATYKNPIRLPAIIHGPQHVFVTKSDNTFTFGVVGDSHMGSKYARNDCLADMYDIFAAEGIKTVFHTGNWVDGEARFNAHDLDVRGLNGQCTHLAKDYPFREGITTYAITGADHEGWWNQREGVDIGAYAERKFRDLGRTDWVDLGYMESPVLVQNKNTKQAAVMNVMHPGGGSAYALSYSMQKLVEHLEGGEKPALIMAGHYHKLWYGNIRNVWVLSTGCTQDQTPFMKQKKIEAHVGGMICRVTQDPDTGALIRCRVEILRYFNKGYYTGKWSNFDHVNLPERSLGGV